MKSFAKISGAISLILFSALTHAAGQYLDDEPTAVKGNTAAPVTSVQTESAISSTTTMEATSESQNIPTVNSAEIGRAVNITSITADASALESEQTQQIENFISMLPKGLGIVVLLIIISTLPSLFGKGVFFWDITDVVVSTLFSMLAAASFVALVVVYLDRTMTDDVHNMGKIILVVCLIAAYILNFMKAKVHNSALLTPLIAFGRLFLPLLILFAVFLARWYGGGRVSYQQQDHESVTEYKARIARQEQELSESKKKSAWWLSLIGVVSVWLYSKLISQKEWRGFAGYFSKIN